MCLILFDTVVCLVVTRTGEGSSELLPLLNKPMLHVTLLLLGLFLHLKLLTYEVILSCTNLMAITANIARIGDSAKSLWLYTQADKTRLALILALGNSLHEHYLQYNSPHNYAVGVYKMAASH